MEQIDVARTRDGPSTPVAGHIAPPPPPVATNTPFPAAARLPTQLGPLGIRYDFNLGCRILLPRREGRWRVTLHDSDRGNILYRAKLDEGCVTSVKRWFIRFRIQIETIDIGEDAAERAQIVFTHEFDASAKTVLVQFPIGTLGDTLAWMPYAAQFAERHACQVICAMSELIAPLLQDAYPDIAFVTHDAVRARDLADTAYATYALGLFFNDVNCNFQPTDFRMVGLHRTAAYILGVDPVEQPARIAPVRAARPIAEPYVVIAVQASTQAKAWNNPHGWPALIAWLKQCGLRVICIDKQALHGAGIVWNHLPHGAEDQTGDRPLSERAHWLAHAECFIGVSSGLAWLAWSAGCPVVMISGFTHPTNEFATPFRVNNWHACNGCWNDPQVRFDHTDHLWCPRHKNTARQFECSRLITADAVIAATGRALASATMPGGAGRH